MVAVVLFHPLKKVCFKDKTVMHDIADRKSRTFWSYAILRKSKVTYSRKSPGEKFSRSFLRITFFEPFDRCISPKTESHKLVSFSSDHLSY